MTNTIDWNAPLEAYHPNGRVVEVEIDKSYHGAENVFPDIDGEYRILGIDDSSAPYFNVSGQHYGASKWRIRNRTVSPAPQYPAELVDALKGMIHEAEWMVAVVPCNDSARQGVKDRIERAKALLPQPADPDLALARACLDAADNSEAAILMAIKRVRGEG